MSFYLFLQQTAVVKKKLNIPVTDIGQDKKYDDDNSYTPFVLPPSYVRHTKIMGDEPDVTMDYCIEDEDIVSFLQKLCTKYIYVRYDYYLPKCLLCCCYTYTDLLCVLFCLFCVVS
jgi:hypothetical protein